MKKLIDMMLLLLLCAAHPTLATSPEAPIINAPAGQMRGVWHDTTAVFQAVPYALPPVNDRRWQPPAPMPRWKGVLDATRKGVACIQPPMADGPYLRERPTMSEDCLTLNITVPENADDAPVMVWIHGGTLIWGTAHSPMYHGREMAKRGVIQVSINYRLGVLGYLAHPELSKESAYDVSGNYGILDQIAALKWVRENIGAFGGNPSNVTIFGESAGALSVEYLLASPVAHGLYDKAIIQSGYLFTMPELRRAVFEEQSAEDNGLSLAKKLNANNLAALRTMDAQTLVDQSAQVGFAPFGNIDGIVLKRQLVETFNHREQAAVPLMAGYTGGEIRSLRFLLPPLPESAADYVAGIRDAYADLADDYLALYPAENLLESQLAASRDAIFGWASERFVRKQSQLGQPAYLYRFDHTYPAATNADLDAFHASEVPFVFGSLNDTPTYWPKVPDTVEQRALANKMLDYWTSFARSALPRATKSPDWSPFSNQHSYMVFDGNATLKTERDSAMYGLHEQIMCRRLMSGKQSWNWRTGSSAPALPAEHKMCELQHK